MHVIVRTHAIQHIHQGKDKTQVQLEPNGYFGKLMHMTTNTHLKINMDTTHQCASGLAAPKKTMCMLADELDEGAEPMHRLKRKQEFASARCHHEVHAHHHERPSLASSHEICHHKHVKELVSPQQTESQ